jgi:hypothetical protein
MYAQTRSRTKQAGQFTHHVHSTESPPWPTSLLCWSSAPGLVGHFGFPVDDSWIHQSVARNFCSFGSLGYLTHERSSGSTSLL